MKLLKETSYFINDQYQSISSDCDFIYLYKNNQIDQYDYNFKLIKNIQLNDYYYSLKHYKDYFICLHTDRTKITIYNQKTKKSKQYCFKHICTKYGLINSCVMYKDELILTYNYSIVKVKINNICIYQQLPIHTNYPHKTCIYFNKQYHSLIITKSNSYLGINELNYQKNYILDTKYNDYTIINNKHYFIKQQCNKTIIDIYILKQPNKSKKHNKEIIQSIANVENSLATILESQSNKIEIAIEQNSNIEELLQINQSVQETIEIITQLESTLLLKLKYANK